VRAGAGRIVSGRPASELTSGEDGGGEGDGEEVCTEIDADMAGGGVDAGCCWLERRDLYLDWGWAWPSIRAAAHRRRSQPRRQSLICSCSSEGSLARATRRRFFRGLVTGVNICRRFPFLRGDTRGNTGV
jgi:hypothetical protein